MRQAEMGVMVMQLQGEEHLGLPESGRGKDGSSFTELHREYGSDSTLVLDLWLPRL